MSRATGEAATKRRPEQFPLLDPLRAVAALSILVLHVSIFSVGYRDTFVGNLLAHLDVGVAFFFVLSAFLLYRPFALARRRGAAMPRLREYAKRRFVRIYPAYWAALTVAAIVPGMAGAFSGDWWAYYSLLYNFPIFEPDGACAEGPYRCAIPPAWSLGVEVVFYAVLPVFALAVDRLARRLAPRGDGLWIELAFCGALTAASLLIQGSPRDTTVERWLFYTPVGFAWWFALGLGLAALSARFETRPLPRPLRAWRHWPEAAAAAALVIYALGSSLAFDAFAVFDLDPAAALAEYLLFGLIGLLAIVPAVFARDAGGPYRRLLAHPVLTWLGLVSYGIFLWQFPVMIALLDVGVAGGNTIGDFLLLLAATTTGTVICAALSYYLIELPLKRRVRSRHAPATAAEVLATREEPESVNMRGEMAVLR